MKWDAATVQLRAYRDADFQLVMTSWVHTYRASPWARLMHPATYSKNQRGKVAGILQRLMPAMGNTCLIACDPHDDTRILGYVCGERQPTRYLAHYVWVRPMVRRMGLANFLWEATRQGTPTVVSHASDVLHRIVGRSPVVRRAVCCANSPHLRYNPDLASNPNAEVAL